MAFSSPPLPPGGGVICVNSRGDMPARPLCTSVQRIAARKNSPMAVAMPESVSARTLMSLRQRAAAHTEESALRSSRSSMKRAAAMTEKVMRNSSAPRAISEEVYRSPTASVNSLAMAAEMVVPGARSEG